MGIVRFEQGDILRVEKIRGPVLIVSKNFFHRTEQAIACPVAASAAPDPLHILIDTGKTKGIVLCEHMRFLDLRIRGYQKIDEVPLSAVMDITDAIQSIFDYYPG